MDRGDQPHRLRDADAVVITQERSSLRREVLEKLPRLKLIAQTGSHRSHIDIDVCTARGIAISALNDGLGHVVDSVTFTIPAGQVRTLASTVTQVFGAYCTFHFQAPPDQVRGFATREDLGGSNTRLLVEATPTVSQAPVAGCCGDCDGSGVVTIDELITAVNFALGSCPMP